MIRKIIGAAATTLIVVAAASLACWFAFSALTGATLITFRTGSMAPTMPQGTLAVTVPVSAADLTVGDVITVQRAGAPMPVTHRIVEVAPVADRPANAADIRAAAPGSGPPDLTSADARQVIVQGDDNDTPDHLPYALTEAQKVVFAVPGMGNTLMLLQSPLGLGALTLLVAALVTWAFWPSKKALAAATQKPSTPPTPPRKSHAPTTPKTPNQSATPETAPQ